MPTDLGLGNVTSRLDADIEDPILRANLGLAKVSSKAYSNISGIPKNTISITTLGLSLVNSEITGGLKAYGNLGVATVSSKMLSFLGSLLLTPPVVEPVLLTWVTKADSPNTRSNLDGYNLALGDSLIAGIELTGERLENLQLSLEAIDTATGETKIAKATGGQGITLSELIPVQGKVFKRTGYFAFSPEDTAALGETTTQLQLVFRVGDNQGYRYTFKPVTIALYNL